MGIVTTIAPVALALIMLGLGASLTVKDFTRVAQNPKDFFIGLFCQLVLLPVVAYFLIIILRTPIELALGVMLIAAAPGGVTSNVLTKFADGDVALSITLTAITSLISIISVNNTHNTQRGHGYSNNDSTDCISTNYVRIRCIFDSKRFY